MNVVGIDHVVLYVEDVDAARAFYADVLDGEPGEYGPGFGLVRFDEAQINLRPAGEGELVAAAPTSGAGDLCLVADEPIEAVLDRLDERGVDVVEGPVGREGARGSMTSVYFRDPEGNLVEVAEYDDRDE